MFQKFKFIGISFSFLLMLSSCSNFKPAYINNPKFEKRGQLNADVNVGSSFGGNLSYSPIKHWAIMANYSTYYNNSNPEDDKDTLIDQNGQFTQQYSYRNYFYEAATGFYWNYNENIYQDFYVGYGEGVAGNKVTYTIFYENFNAGIVAFQNDFQNVFLQSSLRIKVNKLLDIGIHGRVNFLTYSNFKFVYLKNNTTNNLVHRYPIEDVEGIYFIDRSRVAYQFGISVVVKLEHFSIYQQFQLNVCGCHRLEHRP